MKSGAVTMRGPGDLFRSASGRKLVHDRYRAMLREWPVPHQELSIPTCEGETFVISCGRDAGPPIVLLHGGMTTSIMWARSIESWAARFRIHALDIIGDPGFSAPSRPSLKSDAHARWLDDVWTTLGLESAAIVGASFGGLLALDYAIRRPSKVRSLALLAPAGVASVRARYVLTAIPLFLMGPWGRRKAFDYVMGLAPEALKGDGEAFVELFELVMTHFAMRTSPLPTFSDQELRGLKVPLLAILGEKDVVFSPTKVQRRLRKLVPSAKTLVLPGAGHGLTDQTLTVQEFLSAHSTYADRRSLPISTGTA